MKNLSKDEKVEYAQKLMANMKLREVALSCSKSERKEVDKLLK